MNLRLELNNRISKEVVPGNILRKYLASSFPDSSEYWLFRRLFTQQFALSTFTCYAMAFGHRTPAKYSITLCDGQIAISEVLPSIINVH